MMPIRVVVMGLILLALIPTPALAADPVPPDPYESGWCAPDARAHMPQPAFDRDWWCRHPAAIIEDLIAAGEDPVVAYVSVLAMHNAIGLIGHDQAISLITPGMRVTRYGEGQVPPDWAAR